MNWLTDKDGYPHLGRILLLIGLAFTVVGLILAFLVDPGAINMAVAGIVATIIGAVGTGIARLRR